MYCQGEVRLVLKCEAQLPKLVASKSEKLRM